MREADRPEDKFREKGSSWFIEVSTGYGEEFVFYFMWYEAFGF